MTAKERILKIVDLKTGGSIREFERITELSNGYVHKLREDITTKAVNKIICKFPDLNPRWIKNEDGEIFSNSENKSDHTIYNEINLEELKSEIERLNIIIRDKDDIIFEKDERIQELKDHIETLKSTNLQKTTTH